MTLLLKRFLPALLISIACLSGSAHAQTPESEPIGRVRVIAVSGYIDPILSDFITTSIRNSEQSSDEILIIQFDSHGTLLSKSEQTKLENTIRNARIPIGVWVGGLGARATNGTFSIVQAADIVGVAPAVSLGPKGNEMTAAEAINSKQAQISAPVLQQFVFLLDGVVVNGQTLRTADTTANTQKARVIKSDIAFAKPSLVARFMHAAASPSISYLFLVAGLILIIFEFFSVGIGIAAISGLLLLMPSAYGFGVLPTNWWAVVLIVASMFAFSIDIQAGASKFWTVFGGALFVLGSINLFDGLGLPLLTFVPVALLTAIFVLTAMPSTIRARFALPVVGREWLIGEMATATSPVNPDGVIDLRGGTWPARTNRSTPVNTGDRVRVVSIAGSVLEIEPETGGARDAHH